MEGSRKFREVALRYGTPHRTVGKIVLDASEEERKPLWDILESNAGKNGVRTIRLEERGIVDTEPFVQPAIGRIHVPGKRVIDGNQVFSVLKRLLV